MQIEVRNIKSFKGHEGEPLLQGNLFINGEARGFVSDDSHGGPLRIDDHEAYRELTAYAKSFPSEFDFEHAEILVGTVMQREAEAKRIGRAFDTALGWVGEDGLIHLSAKIKGDVAKTRTVWMANPETAKKLKVTRFVTDRNEFIDLFFAENEELQHPALQVKAVVKKVAPVVDVEVKKVDEVKVVKAPVALTNTGTASKMDQCRAIYKANVGSARKDIIALFVAQIGMSAAGASTYYQKLKGE